ncbi:MAG TPA: transcription regulator [Aromatoleum sp.]|uniref:transcription regulator n=1 Tax=Aromatoleum sp. TaxID=2307007 RepID=UPI002B4808DA|nr:transcription regulator [Aromatoleum sp.]HJV27797.1 transcription regulator [Aromatoleum sp.]
MVNPTMPTDPAEPPYAAASSVTQLIAAEVWDHLWPWSHHGFQRQRAMQAASMALGLAASVVWILAAMGQMEAGALIGWWFGWSVFEVVVRLGSKPYVKDGPWWGRRYRVANTMDMVCYVGFKNLLIGATLFIGLKSLGLLTP